MPRAATHFLKNKTVWHACIHTHTRYITMPKWVCWMRDEIQEQAELRCSVRMRMSKPNQLGLLKFNKIPTLSPKRSPFPQVFKWVPLKFDTLPHLHSWKFCKMLVRQNKFRIQF